MLKHTIRLEGNAANGKRIPARVLRDLLDTLLDAAQRSLRLRVDGKSALQGHPEWLIAATNFEFIGLEEGSTVLELEIPSLGESAPKIFEQLPFWGFSPKKEQSALTFVEEALQDAIDGNLESDLLDRNILESFSRLNKVLEYGFDSIILNNGNISKQPVRITHAGLATAEKLRREAPSPERTIVTGYLDELTFSKRAFSLRLSEGHSIRGLLPNGDPGSYMSLWGKRVVVDGEATFRPSGVVSLFLAQNIQEATSKDFIWECMPRPRPAFVDELKPKTSPRPGTNGMDQVFGQWPGDETDEQIHAILAEIG